MLRQPYLEERREFIKRQLERKEIVTDSSNKRMNNLPKRPSSAQGKIQGHNNNLNIHYRGKSVPKRPSSAGGDRSKSPSLNHPSQNVKPLSRPNSAPLKRVQPEEDQRKAYEGRKQSQKRVKEFFEHSHLPPHTCTVFFDGQRNSKKAAQCKRCSMIAQQQVKKQQPVQKKRPKTVKYKEEERLEPSLLVTRENRTTTNNNYRCESRCKSRDSINSLDLFNSYGVNESNDFVVVNGGVPDNYVVTVNSDVIKDEYGYNQYVSRPRRVEIFDDEEYLRLMREYGVDCEPACFHFEILS
ncbi:hypothetical protein ABK040_008593 [Willaertia magna]